MTYSPTLALTLIKAAQHKYTHRKMIGRDPKTNRIRYRYYYKRHHGGGITGAKFEEGSAFQLTWKGRRGHFHIKSIEGDMVKISHDARPDVEIPPIHKDELRAILERQHGAAEEKSREKAQRQRRKSSAKKKSSAKAPKTQAPEPKTQERPPIERMSAAERKALDNDLAKALRDNDPETAHELIKKDQIDYAQSGDSATDEIFRELISAGEVETFDDGTKSITSQGRLSADQLKALENAAQEGLIDGRESGELKVYSLSSSADRDRSLSMLVRADGRAQLKVDDFRPPNDRDQRAIPEGEDLKPPVAKSKLDEHLQAIRDLIETNPALANDPKVIALLGSQRQPKREGRTDEMFLTIDGKERKAEFRYQLIEAGDAIPSHDPVSFSKREDYPEGIQERIYHQDRMEQLKVQRNAGSAYEPSYLINTNPDATNGPPIVTPDGVVLGGNSRVMSTQLVNMRNPEGAKRYKEKLSQDAAIYGFSQADIDAMSSPMLVRVYEPEQTDRQHMAKLVRAMNENKTQGMDERTAGRAAAAKVSQETLKTLQRGLDRFPDFTFNRFLTRPSDALGTFKEALFKDGVLNAQNASELIRPADGTFTATGREFLQSMLTGYVVNDDRLLPNLDYATMEQLTVSLGKLAAAGITEKDRASLQNAIAIYDHGIKRNLVKQKGKPKDRNRAMDVIMLEEQELSFAAAGAEGSESDDLSVSKIPIGEIKERVRQDPLASAFLKILVLNPGTKKLEDTMKQFVKLTEDTGQAGLFGGDETLDYTEAANKLAGELAKEHEIESRLYELPEKSGPSPTRDQDIRQQALQAVSETSLSNIETQPFADLSDAGQKALDLEAGANALESQMREATAAEKKELKARARKARKLADQLFHYDRAKDMVRETLARRARGEEIEMPRGNKKLQPAIDQVIADAGQRGSSWLMKSASLLDLYKALRC
jgi:hypothetical protein